MSSLTLAWMVLAVLPSTKPNPDRSLDEPIAAPESSSLPFERRVLDNGLTVLLAPDPEAQSVLIDISYGAGTLVEPPGKSGLAHFVEHLLYTGPTEDTDYHAMLDERGARDQNAFTSPNSMFFRAILPPRELPFGLWVLVDRMMELPKHLHRHDLEKQRDVVLVERLQRSVDVEYGEADLAMFALAFPKPHPLHAQVVGDPAELASITFEDIRRFVQRWIVPENATLRLVGRFDPKVANEWIDRTLGRATRGAGNAPPELKSTPVPNKIIPLKEKRSRRPRVSTLWRLGDLEPRDSFALSFGASLLSSYVSGSFGSQVSAQFAEFGGEAYFRIDVTLPYEKPISSSTSEAEVFMRYLTHVEFPTDFFNATRVAVDRQNLFALDSLEGRSSLLQVLGQAEARVTNAAELLRTHWTFRPQDVQHRAWKQLVNGKSRLIVHARPQNPRKAKLDWQEREEIE